MGLLEANHQSRTVWDKVRQVTASWELDHHRDNKKQCQLEFSIPKL